VVYNGYDERFNERLSEEKINAVKNKFNLTEPFFFFVGRLEYKKNIVRLVEAFIKFKNQQPESKQQLVLSGPAGFGFDEAAALIKKSNYADAVKMLGWLEFEELQALYQSATAFVFPSLYEGFGIPVLEAFASRCPVICSSTTSLPEVAGKAALFIDPLKVEDLVSAFEQISREEQLRHDLISKGGEQVKKFSWQKCARATLAILENC
jgi:glycosyltransferase involved in cell wall biosynthesis